MHEKGNELIFPYVADNRPISIYENSAKLKTIDVTSRLWGINTEPAESRAEIYYEYIEIGLLTGSHTYKPFVRVVLIGSTHIVPYYVFFSGTIVICMYVKVSTKTLRYSVKKGVYSDRGSN